MRIKELEKAFADDFGSPVFPMLADYYLNEKTPVPKNYFGSHRWFS